MFSLVQRSRRLFLTGLIILAPLGLTLYFLAMLSDWAAQILALVPAQFHPDTLLDFHVPGLDVVLVVFLVFVTGFFANNIIGRQLVHLWNTLLGKIPMVRAIYSTIHQMLSGMMPDPGKEFQRVGLVEYPRKGVYSLGFITGSAWREGEEKAGQHLLNVFIPTSPNVTTGFFIVLPENEILPAGMSVKEALQLLLSSGLIIPKPLGSAPSPPIPPPEISKDRDPRV